MKTFIMGAFLLLQFGTKAQLASESRKFPVKGTLANVIDWGSRSLIMLSDAFFDETEDSIIVQIGQQEFNEMKNKCSTSGWPEGFYKSGLSHEEENIFHATLNKLKMYKIATFTHMYNGVAFSPHVILRIPFDENKFWNLSIKWENNIYFLMEEKDVRAVR